MKAGILFLVHGIDLKKGKSSKGILSSVLNFKVAIDKISAGAPLQGEILATLMHSADAVINPELAGRKENRQLLDKVAALPKKINTNKDMDMRAYSTLVSNLWPALMDKVVQFTIMSFLISTLM